MSEPVRVEWRASVLGTKLDECPACHKVGRHVLVRETRWLTVGPLGVLPFGLRHGMACAACDEYLPIPRSVLRRGIHARSLAFEGRSRPAIDGGGAGASIGSEIDLVTPAAGIDGSTWYLAGWAIAVFLAVGLLIQPKAPQPETGPVCLSEVGADAGQPLPSSATVFQLAPTPCSVDHNFEVLADTKAPFDGNATEPPQGDLGPVVQADCEAAYAKVFGRASAGAPVELIVFAPDPVDWIRGGRTATCTAYDPAHPWMVGAWQRGTASPAPTQ